MELGYGGFFLVKYAYQSIYDAILVGVGLNDFELKFLSKLWKSKVPGKVKIFGWCSILNSFPVKAKLLKRCVFHDASLTSCPICDVGCKTAIHLLFGCSGSRTIWEATLEWLLGEKILIGSAAVISVADVVSAACGSLARFVFPPFVVFSGY